MKKYLFHILTVTLLASFLFSGCESLSVKSKPVSNINSSDTNSSVSSSTDVISSASSAAAENNISSSINNPKSAQIINNISAKLKAQFSDIDFTNEWLGGIDCPDTIVLFGSLKSDPYQGVAQVIMYNSNHSKVLHSDRYITPNRNGAVSVKIAVEAKSNTMNVVDEKGYISIFNFNNGFTAMLN
jgi:hypothetical protein